MRLPRIAYRNSPGLFPASGFTLIELMIVITIVALLVALAVPAYKNYTIRAKIGECINSMAVPKIKIAEFYQVMDRWPSSAQEAGVADLIAAYYGNVQISRFCRFRFYNEVAIGGVPLGNLGSPGAFWVWVDSEALHSSLTGINIIPALSPSVQEGGAIDWKCTRGFTDEQAVQFLPAQCREESD